MNYFSHPTAEISPGSKIGKNTKIWHYSQIRQGVSIGKNCILGKAVYVDFDVRIGNNVKIQNRASVYHGTTIEDGVFIGPHVIFTNDKNPRAIDQKGKLKTDNDWKVGKTLVKNGASIGAGSIILGSVVTKNIPDYALVYGNPARVHGKVDKSGAVVKNT